MSELCCPLASKSNVRSARASGARCNFPCLARENPQTELPLPAAVAARPTRAAAANQLSGACFSLRGLGPCMDQSPQAKACAT